MIPFIDLKAQYEILQSNIQQRINNVLDHGQYILGPEVEELEEKLANFTGAKHCIAVSSGTDALLISLMALNVQPGDEVITTPFTFVATAEVIALLGAKPVFVDIEPDTCNINVSKIEAAITLNTKAIIPVSLYGQPADMKEINIIANKFGIRVIEDAAQSFGAIYQGKKSCNLSTIGCTSFFPSKPLGCYGDGGAIFTNNDDIAKIAKELRVHGQSQRYIHTRIGIGGRLDTIQAAVLLAKLEQFYWEIDQRVVIGERYNAMLDSIGVSRVQQRADRSSMYAQYTVLINDRDSIQEKLKNEGIPTAVHYPLPLNSQEAYKHYCCPGCTPVADELANCVMSLPMHPYLSEQHQDIITQALA
tara:strand:- start:49318 stop:50400 length:1083 start_codon:yes stop_codon:yes gene_type:complete